MVINVCDLSAEDWKRKANLQSLMDIQSSQSANFVFSERPYL